jgi:hypothetical protein
MDARIKSGHDGCVLWSKESSASHTHQFQNFKQPRPDTRFQIRVRALAAQCARVVHLSLAQKRAWGMPDARCTRGLVCALRLVKSTRVYEYTGITRHSRTQWFYGLCRALGDRALLPPSSRGYRFVTARLGQQNSAKLDASVGASGPHDFAVREKRLSSACR